MTEHVIPNEPPWIVEIDGTSYMAPEAVVLLLKAVSEERDELKAKNEALSEASGHLLDVIDALLKEA